MKHKFQAEIQKIQNPDMKDIFSHIFPNDDIYYKNCGDEFIKKYGFCKPEDISWNEICSYAKEKKHSLICLKLIFELLSRNLYRKDHSSTLYLLKSFFSEILTVHKCLYEKILCGDDIESLEIIPAKIKDSHYIYVNLPFVNSILRKIFVSFLSDPLNSRYCKNSIPKELFTLFEESLCNNTMKIESAEDFNEKTFWCQIDFYKQKYINCTEMRSKGIRLIIWFYRYLVKTYSEHSFFEGAQTITESLLFTSRFSEQINDNYAFLPLDTNGETVEPYKKIVFIIRGFDRYSTRLEKEDSFPVDLSAITNPLYRKDIIKYILSVPEPSYFSDSGSIISLCKILSNILKVKSTPEYENPSLWYFTNADAAAIRYFCTGNGNLKFGTMNNSIGAIRRFLQWEEATGKMKFDEDFFENLSQFEEPGPTSAHAIPTNDVIALIEKLQEKSKSDLIYSHTLTIFILLIETEFRVSQICSLTDDCIKPMDKPNLHMIYSYSKVSHGTKDHYAIAEPTYRLLMNAINNTEKVREECNISQRSNKIFLYTGKFGATDIMTGSKFSDCLEQCCKELGWDYKYTAINVRDTYMTESYYWALAHGIDPRILSKHRHLDTTRNHYVDKDICDVLEALYNVIIGDTAGVTVEEALNKILDKIPDEINNNAHKVMHGGGFCNHEDCILKNCIIRSELPCLICRHFITTVEHKPFFEKSIEMIDVQIDFARADDIELKNHLTILKQLYALYLAAICQHIENKDK